MLALGAAGRGHRPQGRAGRSRSTQFFLGLFRTALRPDEILDRDPDPGAAAAVSGGAYLKLERKVGDFATAAAAAQVTLGERRRGRDGSASA